MQKVKENKFYLKLCEYLLKLFQHLPLYQTKESQALYRTWDNKLNQFLIQQTFTSSKRENIFLLKKNKIRLQLISKICFLSVFLRKLLHLKFVIDFKY